MDTTLNLINDLNWPRKNLITIGAWRAWKNQLEHYMMEVKLRSVHRYDNGQ